MSAIADVLLAFGASFVTIGVAELGDRTQLLIIAASSRYHAWRFLGGALLALALSTAAAVWFGRLLAATVDGDVARVGAGLLVIAMGIATLLRVGLMKARPFTRRPVAAKTGAWAGFGLVLVAELGDKSQLATLALAARYESIPAVWLGSFLAHCLLATLAVLAGSWIRGRLSRRVLGIAAGTVFLVVGAAMLVWPSNPA